MSETSIALFINGSSGNLAGERLSQVARGRFGDTIEIYKVKETQPEKIAETLRRIDVCIGAGGDGTNARLMWLASEIPIRQRNVAFVPFPQGSINAVNRYTIGKAPPGMTKAEYLIHVIENIKESNYDRQWIPLGQINNEQEKTHPFVWQQCSGVTGLTGRTLRLLEELRHSSTRFLVRELRAAARLAMENPHTEVLNAYFGNTRRRVNEITIINPAFPRWAHFEIKNGDNLPGILLLHDTQEPTVVKLFKGLTDIWRIARNLHQGKDPKGVAGIFEYHPTHPAQQITVEAIREQQELIVDSEFVPMSWQRLHVKPQIQGEWIQVLKKRSI